MNLGRSARPHLRRHSLSLGCLLHAFELSVFELQNMAIIFPAVNVMICYSYIVGDIGIR